MKEYLHPSLENIEVKNEFGFDTDAAASRSVAKRMSEFLTSIFSNEGLISPYKNLKFMFSFRRGSNRKDIRR